LEFLVNKEITSPNAPAAFSAYAPAMETPAGSRWLHISGQVGVDRNGVLAQGAAAQNRQAWENIFALLAAAGMDKKDIVEVIAIVVDPADVGQYRAGRDDMLGGHHCASTLLVCGLASPDWRVEIAVRAARIA
jgi:2-iminobutanoate/2-iminopropanoate deaminase